MKRRWQQVSTRRHRFHKQTIMDSIEDVVDEVTFVDIEEESQDHAFQLGHL
jgi:hypothetical protein